MEYKKIILFIMMLSFYPATSCFTSIFHRICNFFGDETASAYPKSKLTFADVVGHSLAKEELSTILKFIENPDLWYRYGLSLEPIYLFFGPSRTGKSFLIEAFAGELRNLLIKHNRNPEEFCFYSMRLNTIQQMGTSAFLAMVKKAAPCIIHIDELDALHFLPSDQANFLVSFITDLSCSVYHSTQKPIVVLGSTHSPEIIPEWLHPGKYGKFIELHYPNFVNRKEFITKKLHELSIHNTTKVKKEFNINTFDIDKIAQDTSGSSYEDLNSLIRYAFQKSIEYHTPLNQELIEKILFEKHLK